MPYQIGFVGVPDVPGGTVAMVGIPEALYQDLAGLRAASTALLALATQLNTRVQGNPALNAAQVQALSIGVAGATAHLLANKDYLKI